MEFRKVFIICSIMVSVVTISISQTIPLSKWKVDKKNYFLYQNCISSNKNDTIFFIGIASFHCNLLNIDSVEKITYIKQTKKIVLCGTKKGTIKFSNKIIKTMLTPITEISDSYPIDTIEYIIGEKTVYFK
jgi:hypothetical protein